MVYVHVPFCRSFCTYCDFYSEIACRGRDGSAFESYADGICREIDARRDGFAGTSAVNTLYIGGGTPSVLPLSCLGRIVSAVRSVMPGNFEEFTLEVNPDDICERGPEYLAALREMGVDRISMGVQSLDDGMLRWMNRRHDADGARKAFRMLRGAGFDNISVDLITGISPAVLPNAADPLQATLSEVLEWHPEHISAYQLSIEEGSALGRMVGDGRYDEASEEFCRSQYELLCRTLRDAGYRHYEISNWALPGREAVHNGAYWTRAPYIGLGPGAHSLSADGRTRSWNSQRLSGWSSSQESLSDAEIHEEIIMLGLRTAAGIGSTLLEGKEPIVADMTANGSLEALNGGRIRIPENRFFVSDEIISQLI